MPHECTTCGRVFADGSKQMLSGCPDCGGNKFQFRPAGATESAPGTDSTDTTADATGEGTTADATGEGTTTDATGGDTDPDGASQPGDTKHELSAGSRQWPDHGYGSDDADPADPTDTAGDSAEDPAQASARTDVVSPDEIASAGPEGADPEPADPPDPERDAEGRPSDADGHVIEPTSGDRPELEDLRKELNEQFESIRIVAPGEYELNLMELYDRTEYIISLQEDGRYVIEVPDTWDTTPDADGT